MFTGIVESVGEIEKIENARFTILHCFPETLKLGESVALNGMCSTVVKFTDKTFEVDIMEESRNCTTFGDCTVGGLVNLERSIKIGQRNSGHNVTGHIDEVGKILKIEKQSDFYLVRVGFNPKNRKLVVQKGSVALGGISLTVSGVGDDWLEVSIISHTWKYTTLQTKNISEGLNIEFDIYGKYVLNQAM